ncbi:MAG: ECF transporter S component [Promethearchaeota archaeon]
MNEKDAREISKASKMVASKISKKLNTGINKVQETSNVSRMVASLSIFTALMVILNMLSIPVPKPIEYIGFAPVLTYIIGILLKPKWAFLICAVGSVLGQLLTSLFITGSYVELPVYLVGAFVARGLEGLFISILEQHLVRKRGLFDQVEKDAGSKGRVYLFETIILLVGGTWEVFGYYIVGGPYYNIIYGIPYTMSLIWYLTVFIDLLFVPIAITLILAIRRAFSQAYLDVILFKDRS